MRCILLNGKHGLGRYVIVDDEDFDRLSAFQWRGMPSSSGLYAVRTLPHQRHRFLHHEVMGMPPAGMVTDHISGDRLDNRRCNLRFCTHAQNVRNQRPSNKTGMPKGVHKIDGLKTNPYRARIGIDGKLICLGLHPTPEAAARAYDMAALYYHGEFARTNGDPFADSRAA